MHSFVIASISSIVLTLTYKLESPAEGHDLIWGLDTAAGIFLSRQPTGNKNKQHAQVEPS